MDFIELNEMDFIVRIQLIESKLSDLTVSLIAKIKIGSQDVECKLNELDIIGEMLDYIKCYKIDEEINCITECELLKMFDYIALNLRLTFQYPGFRYT